ncbi:serine/threonine protein kinase [Kitasatospora sp. NPDC057500]|uniref:serine/threonine protein kinase n=1 Tax=Kitasatospora sp. NPDC057500 TaxID=3346151 RepID=UPI00368952EB
MRGTTLGDRYRLDEWLGGGSMGDVWLAQDQVLDRRVAVKVLKPALLEEPGFAERFHDEARVMARLQHPGIVGVYDFGPGRTTEDVPSWGAPSEPAARPVAYLVMELIDGEPLSTVMERRGPLSVPEALGLALEVLGALQAAHEAGIVHRDIKPANLMVRDGHVVITDFGIARPGCDPRLTVPGMVLGTAAYQAPEQASTGTVTASADLYALGVVLYECLAGRLPFEGETALELILKHLTDPVPPLPAEVPAPVRVLVERAMAKDPALRWPDAAGMAAAVLAALTGEPAEGLAPGPSWAAVVRSTGAPAALRATGSAVRPAVADEAGAGAGASAPPRRAARWRAALFGTRRRALLVAGAATLCCAITATAAVVLHREGSPADVRAATAASSGQAGLPLTAPVGLLPDPDAPSPSPGAPTPSGAPSPSAPALPPDAPLPEAGAVGGAAAGGAAAGGVAAGGVAGAGGAAGGAAVGAASNAPANTPGAPPAPAASDAPAGSAAPPDPSPAPGQPSTPDRPAYTAAPPPSVPAYTSSPGRTVPPAPDYTYAPKPTYTSAPPPYTAAPPPPPPTGTVPTDPPVKPPTQPGGPLPPYVRLSNGGSVLYDQASLNRPGNPVITASDDGGTGGIWQLTPYVEGGYALSNGATEYSKVLNLEETRAQTQLAYRPVPPATAPTQVWSFFPVPGGYVVTVARDAKRCLSAAGPGVPATVRTCAGSADQVWTVSAA